MTRLLHVDDSDGRDGDVHEMLHELCARPWIWPSDDLAGLRVQAFTRVVRDVARKSAFMSNMNRSDLNHFT